VPPGGINYLPTYLTRASTNIYRVHPSALDPLEYNIRNNFFVCIGCKIGGLQEQLCRILCPPRLRTKPSVTVLKGFLVSSVPGPKSSIWRLCYSVHLEQVLQWLVEFMRLADVSECGSCCFCRQHNAPVAFHPCRLLLLIDAQLDVSGLFSL